MFAAAMALLVLAAVLRALAGLLEAATLLVLALVIAVLTVPRGLTRHWPRLCRKIPGWLQTAAEYFEGFAPASPAGGAEKTEKS